MVWFEPLLVCRRLQLLRKWSHDEQDGEQFSPEVCARPVRFVLDHEAVHPSRWAATVSVPSKIGCAAQSLHQWIGKAERDSGRKPGLTTDMAAKMKALECEVRELRQANEILRKASARSCRSPLQPSRHGAKRADLAKLSPRTKQDIILKPEIARVFSGNFEVYGVRKVWRQMMRERFNVARSTVERLMRGMGLAGVIRGKSGRTTVQDWTAAGKDH
jgi:transposase-like protein